MASSLTFTLGLNNRPLLNALSSAQSALSGFSRAAGGIAGSVSGAFRGITSSIRSSITLLHEINGAVQAARAGFETLLGPVKMAAQIETARVQFRVLIGDIQKADEIFGRLSKLADDNPILDLGDVAKAAATLAATSIDKTGIPEFLTQLGGAAGDTQKFLQMVTAASQVLAKGGKVQGDELLQFADAGLPVIEEMARVLNVTGEEFTSMQQKGEVTFDVLSEAIRNLTTGTGRYAGMAAAAAQTTAGRWNAVVVAVQQAQRAFGEKILVALVPILEKAQELAAQLLPWAVKAGEKVRDIALFLLAAFKSGQLGNIVWGSLKFAGLSFIDLIGRGLLAVGGKFKEILSEAASSIGDKITLALPSAFTSKDARDGASAREDLRAKGIDPGGSKTFAQYFQEAKTGLDEPIQKIRNDLFPRIALVGAYAEVIKSNLENDASRVGEKSPNAALGSVIRQEKNAIANGSGGPDAGLLPQPMTPGALDWTGPLLPGQSAPGTGGGRSGGGGGGAGGGDDSEAGGGSLSRREQTLVNSFSRQANTGRGAQNWQQFLGSNLRTAGISPERMSALRGINPEGLANVSTRRNRTQEDRQQQAASQRDAKSGAAVDAVIRGIPSMAADLKQVKDHLSKLQVR